MFAKRTAWDLTPNRMWRLRQDLERRGVSILDLTESNPTQAGLVYPGGLLEALADPAGLLYEPDAKGALPARQAVASTFARKGARVDPERIVLTASTSEAYSFLFRLLADPGDQVLVPGPSYPLFDYLAQLNDLEQVRYSLRLNGTGGWEVDLDQLRKAAGPRSRILVVVHPNNPTGSCLRREDLEELVEFCGRRGLSLVSDEVFAEYLFREDPAIPATLLRESGALHFALGGLSKFLGLPQMKLAWIACGGDSEAARPALERLELIADTTLSVNTPVQTALPAWLKQAAGIQAQIRGRLQENHRLLEGVLQGGPGRLLPSDGGWSAVLRFPQVQDEEEWCLRLLERWHVWLHPGYFFDFEEPGMLVVSLLTLPARLREGVQRVLRHAGA